MYLLFASNGYYPNGGLRDFCGVFETLDEAKAAYPGNYDEAHIGLLIPGEKRIVVVAVVDTPGGSYTRNVPINWQDVEKPTPIDGKYDF